MKEMTSIAREILRRPVSEMKEPYEVPLARWLTAWEEMPHLPEDRQRLCADINRINFILCGVPVVPIFQEAIDG